MNPLFFLTSLLIADEFDLGPDFDTGGPEEQIYDPSPIWPSKVITDAVNQQVMLVWFEYGHSRTINIPFSQVKEVRIVPAEVDLQEEAHLVTNDGKRFMLAYGSGSANNIHCDWQNGHQRPPERIQNPKQSTDPKTHSNSADGQN